MSTFSRRAGPTEAAAPAALLLLSLLLAAGCQGTLDLRATDQASPYDTKPAAAPSIQVPEGFRAVRVVEGLNFPSSLTWDSEGRLYILESHTVPVPTLKPKILRLGAGGKLDPIPLEGAAAPSGERAVGLVFHQGWLYFSHEEKDASFGISRVRPEGGNVESILRDLPAQGDHDVNYLIFDAKGNLFFGLGSATNSGVVSSHDPVNKEWLAKHPEVSERSCRDLVLTGQTFREKNDLTPDETDESITGAYQPYGRSASNAPAQFPCTGAVYRLPPGAKRPELMAWGFRNPVALAFDSEGTLLVGMHGADVRGTRPVLDDPDAIYRVRQGAWYGWPDYSAELLPITDPRYRPPAKFLAAGHQGLQPLIDREKSDLSPPDRSLLVAVTEPHAALGGMMVVPKGGPFSRWAGQLLISEMGDFKPTTDAVKATDRAGFQVEAVDLATGKRSVFARNRSAGDSLPASLLDFPDGFERPVDVKMGPDGLVYVLDFGVFNPTEKTPKVFPKTGRVFRIEPVAGR